MRTLGRPITVEIEMYDECKYTANKEVFDNSRRSRFDGVVSWEIVTGYDATQIGLETDKNSRDDNNEYLVLHFEEGSKATFRNSYVDMFRI